MHSIALPNKSALKPALKVVEAAMLVVLTYFVAAGYMTQLDYSNYSAPFSAPDPVHWVAAQTKYFHVTSWTYVWVFAYALVTVTVFWWLVKTVVVALGTLHGPNGLELKVFSAARRSLSPAIVMIFLSALPLTVARILWVWAIWGGA